MRKINNLKKFSSDKTKKFSYPVRTYTDKELKEFFKLDKEETKELRTNN